MPQLNFKRLPRASDVAEHLLTKAERAFGPRDTDWTFGGVTEWPGGPLVLYLDDKEAMIGISPGADADECKLPFQLAHEVVHLPSPHRGQYDAMMIEEGAAVWFSIYGPEFPIADYRGRVLDYIRPHADTQNYRCALDLHTNLDAVYPNSIRALRAARPRFYEMTPEFIVETVGASKVLADQLCERVTMRPR